MMKQWFKRCVECATSRYYPEKSTKCAVCGGRVVMARAA